MGLNGYVFEFSVDYNIIDISNAIDSHKYLMKKTWYTIIFGIIKKTFIALLASIAYVFNHAKCVSLSNKKCENKPTVINLHLNKSSQEFHYYQFAVKLDRCLEVVILKL